MGPVLHRSAPGRDVAGAAPSSLGHPGAPHLSYPCLCNPANGRPGADAGPAKIRLYGPRWVLCQSGQLRPPPPPPAS
eukprot:1966081-Pyramimonas_sp.AAC.1